MTFSFALNHFILGIIKEKHADTIGGHIRGHCSHGKGHFSLFLYFFPFLPSNVSLLFQSMPGTLPTPECCNSMLLRDRCCSNRCNAADNCEFSTYKSFTSISEFVRRCAWSFKMTICASTVLLSSLISARCWCHVSICEIIQKILFSQIKRIISCAKSVLVCLK